MKSSTVGLRLNSVLRFTALKTGSVLCLFDRVSYATSRWKKRNKLTMRSDRVPITVLSCNLTQHRPSLALNFKWPLTFVCTYHRHTSLLSFQLWALHLKWKHKRCPHFQTPEGHLTLDSFLWGINKTNPFQWPASLFKIIPSSLWEKLSGVLGLTRNFRVRPLWLTWHCVGISLVIYL